MELIANFQNGSLDTYTSSWLHMYNEYKCYYEQPVLVLSRIPEMAPKSILATHLLKIFLGGILSDSPRLNMLCMLLYMYVALHHMADVFKAAYPIGNCFLRPPLLQEIYLLKVCKQVICNMPYKVMNSMHMGFNYVMNSHRTTTMFIVILTICYF